jgi:hypothetical protein
VGLVIGVPGIVVAKLHLFLDGLDRSILVTALLFFVAIISFYAIGQMARLVFITIYLVSIAFRFQYKDILVAATASVCHEVINPNVSSSRLEKKLTGGYDLLFLEYWSSIKGHRPTLNAPSRRSRRPAAVLAQSSIAWAIDSIANPHLNDDPGIIIPFSDETFGLNQLIQSRLCQHKDSIAYSAIIGR